MGFRVDHIGVWTADLERLRTFYVEWFGAVSGEKYSNQAKGFESYFLSFQGGPRIEIMTSTNLVAGGQKSPFPGYAHIALSVGSESDIDALTRKLRSEGVTVVDGPRRTGDGYYESVVLDPDGNRIEITT